MHARLHRLVLGLTALTCTTALLWAHPDDPKVQDLEQPYEGRGFRAGDQPLEQGYPSDGITLQAWLPLGELMSGAANGNDCWGYVSPSGREYALAGVSTGIVVVEITNPASPVIVERLTGPTSLWHDVKVYGDHAYAVSEGGSGIRIIDLTQVDQGIVSQSTSSNGATHNVAINTDSGRLYRCGGNVFGTAIYSLDNPSQPAFMGNWTDHYVHDAQIVSYTEGAFAGREIMFACVGRDGMRILDVTDPANVTVVSEFHYDERYAHQCWLAPDRKTLYVGDELDESGTNFVRTYVFNVENLERPRLLGSFTNETNSVDHNLYTRDGLIFEANYRTGLRVFDATIPEQPVEVAYFDTYPTSDTAQFNGLWSNYPLFPSRTIIGSDMQRGLFIWTLDGYPLSIVLPDGPLPSICERGDALTVSISTHTPTAAPQDVVLHYNLGGGDLSTMMIDNGDGTYTATLPEACNTTMDYYIEVSDGNGFSTTSPVDAPNHTYTTYIAGRTALLDRDEMELDEGWTVNPSGTDTATVGFWTRGDPLGSTNEPADDVTTVGTDCWYTGAAAPGEGPGMHDVDNGRTRLLSPSFDLTGVPEPAIAYWRWFSNSNRLRDPDDPFTVHISNDDGENWVIFEQIEASARDTVGGWRYHMARVRPIIEPTSTMRLRFTATDTRTISRVEAAIDDLQIIDLRCTDCPQDGDGDGQVGLFELSELLTQFGETEGTWSADQDNDGDVDLEDLAKILQTFGQTCD